jgi:hypothetical protein
MRSFGRVGAALAMFGLAGGMALAEESTHLRGTLTAIDGDVLTVENEDEEQVEVGLTADTGIYVVRPAKFADIKAGQYVGVTSVEQSDQRVALEVHIFAEDLRGTGEGHFPWDLVKGPNAMTNATIADVEEASPVERVLRLTYKAGEGHKQDEGEQVIRVPDFADVVYLESADRSALVPDRPVFLFVKEATPQPVALAVAVGEGAAPPM